MVVTSADQKHHIRSCWCSYLLVTAIQWPPEFIMIGILGDWLLVNGLFRWHVKIENNVRLRFRVQIFFTVCCRQVQIFVLVRSSALRSVENMCWLSYATFVLTTIWIHHSGQFSSTCCFWLLSCMLCHFRDHFSTFRRLLFPLSFSFVIPGMLVHDWVHKSCSTSIRTFMYKVAYTHS